MDTTETSRMDKVLAVFEREMETLRAVYADAVVRQWEASQAPRPREDTAERSSGGRPADPTGDIVLDGRRLALRDAVRTADEAALRAAASVVAARKHLERAVDRYDGPEA